MSAGPSSRIKHGLELVSLTREFLLPCKELDRLVLNGIWSDTHWRKELSDPCRLCLGIMNSTELIAFACGWIVVEEINLTAIAVHPEWRRIGLASLLIGKLLQKAYPLGVSHATLEVDVSNQPAILLYKNFGFKTIGKRNSYYRNGNDALILRKFLIYDAKHKTI